MFGLFVFSSLGLPHRFSIDLNAEMYELNQEICKRWAEKAKSDRLPWEISNFYLNIVCPSIMQSFHTYSSLLYACLSC